MENQYKELLTAIIKKQSSMIGMSLAVKKAQNIAGLEVDENGNVTACAGDALKMVEELVNAYSALAGDMAIKFCKEASKPVEEKYPSLAVPAVLQ